MNNVHHYLAVVCVGDTEKRAIIFFCNLCTCSGGDLMFMFIVCALSVSQLCSGSVPEFCNGHVDACLIISSLLRE